jgi:8-oxo-dGTP diphosphatase
MDKQIPKIGIGIMIWKDGKVLLGKRKGSHGEGLYCFPGGALDYGETLAQCAQREVREETGIEIQNIRFNVISDELEYMPKHYVNVMFIADWKSGEVELREPEKCESWDWYDIEHLPEPLFPKTKSAFEAHKAGIHYFDSTPLTR